MGEAKRKREQAVAYAYTQQSMDEGIEVFERLVMTNRLEKCCILCKTSIPDEPFKLIMLDGGVKDLAWMLQEAGKALASVAGEQKA